MSQEKGLNVFIVGGGPIGLLTAMYAAQRGHDVQIYELRSDPRSQTSRANQGKSIQLTLTRRGIQPLQRFDHLFKTVMDHSMPVQGRMLHLKDRTGAVIPSEHLYGTDEGHLLHCICRQELQGILLEAACRMPNITILFDCKIEDVDFERKLICIRDNSNAEARSTCAYDLLIGADGAHSAVRECLARHGHCGKKSSLLDCLWTEFPLTNADARYSLSSERLHVWPSQKSMFVAMPKPSGDFVATWFAPFDHYQRLDSMTDKAMISSMDSLHPGIFHVLDRSAFIRQIREGSRQKLYSITSDTYHWKDSVVLLGDAANAIVPFYGQGTNSGFESVQLFWRSIDNNARLGAALSSYTVSRLKNLHCISDLALEHFKELRGDVSRLERTWRLIETYLETITGSNTWASEYSMVAFSELQYGEVRRCVSLRRKRVIQWLLLMCLAMALLAWAVLRRLYKS